MSSSSNIFWMGPDYELVTLQKGKMIREDEIYIKGIQ